jgi:hypothetical protein
VPPYEVPLTRPSEEDWDGWETIGLDRLLEGFDRAPPADFFKGASVVTWKCHECGERSELSLWQ